MTDQIEGLNSVSSEQLRVRKLQALASPEIAPLKPTAPLGFDRSSSIESVKPSIDPLFAPPHTQKVNPVHDQAHYFLVLLRMVNVAQEMISHTIAHSTDRTNASLQDQYKLLEERGKALEEELQASQSVDWWAAASMVTSYLVDVAFLTLSTNQAAKIAGAIGLLYRLADDLGITDMLVGFFSPTAEAQAQVKEGLGYLAAAIRLTGLVFMIHAASTAPREEAMKLVDKIRNAVGAASLAVQVRAKWAEYDHSSQKGEIITIDGRLRMVQHRLQQAMREAQKDPEMLNHILKMAQANMPETISG
jgi:hypothetical protein